LNGCNKNKILNNINICEIILEKKLGLLQL
jgi:hypothetical protein